MRTRGRVNKCRIRFFECRMKLVEFHSFIFEVKRKPFFLNQNQHLWINTGGMWFTRKIDNNVIQSYSENSFFKPSLLYTCVCTKMPRVYILVTPLCDTIYMCCVVEWILENRMFLISIAKTFNSTIFYSFRFCELQTKWIYIIYLIFQVKIPDFNGIAYNTSLFSNSRRNFFHKIQWNIISLSVTVPLYCTNSSWKIRYIFNVN